MRMAALALLWGSAFLWIKLALNHGLAPLQVAFIRSALGAAVLVGLARIAHQRLPRDRATWAQLVVAAFFCNTCRFSSSASASRPSTPAWPGY